MKSAQFDYRAPATLDETVSLLHDHGDHARVLAGGQSLVPLLAQRLVRPSIVIDLAGVHGLDSLTAGDAGLVVGAMVRDRTAERSALVRERSPLLPQVLSLVGHPSIRVHGTIGGSMAHGAPAAELPAAAVALDAVFVAESASHGSRRIAAGDFFTGRFRTALGAHEVLTEIHFPATGPGVGTAFEEVSRRHVDFALVGVAAMMRIDGGLISEARIVVTGVADTPIRSSAGEAVLRGATPSEDAFSEAAARVSAELTPPSDVQASSAYRRHVSGVLVRRALHGAAARAGDVR